MTELERYLFDLQGFLVIEDALTTAQIADLNQLLDQQIALNDQPGKQWLRFNRLLPLGDASTNILLTPRLGRNTTTIPMTIQS